MMLILLVATFKIFEPKRMSGLPSMNVFMSI